MKDYYRVLDVRPGVSDAVIRAAYRKLAKKYHPDANVTNSMPNQLAETRMKALNEAYDTLKDPIKRAWYDRQQSYWRQRYRSSQRPEPNSRPEAAPRPQPDPSSTPNPTATAPPKAQSSTPSPARKIFPWWLFLCLGAKLIRLTVSSVENPSPLQIWVAITTVFVIIWVILYRTTQVHHLPLMIAMGSYVGLVLGSLLFESILVGLLVGGVGGVLVLVFEQTSKPGTHKL